LEGRGDGGESPFDSQSDSQWVAQPCSSQPLRGLEYGLTATPAGQNRRERKGGGRHLGRGFRAPRRSTVTPAAQAPEVVAAREWVAQSGFADDITITSAGRLRVDGLELDPVVLLELSSDEALELLTSAAIRAELGDPEEFEP
jgi:hypothetical protein